MLKKKTRALIRYVKYLYEEHDHAEGALVMATRRQELAGNIMAGLWAYHDDLERDIVMAESKLPQRIVERLKRGEL